MQEKELYGEGMVCLTGDGAFYHKHKDGKLIGCVLTHVDDFLITGTDSFIKSVTEKVKERLAVSKIEDNSFRFTGLVIKKTKEAIVVSMEDYAQSIEQINKSERQQK